MLKKFMIVCVCAVAVIAVFGFNDRLTYDGFQTAADAIIGDSAIIKSDFTMLEVLTFCIENYNAEADLQINVVQNVDTLEYGISYNSSFDDAWRGGRADPEPVTIHQVWYGLTEDDAVKMVRTLQPLTWGLGTYSGLFETVVNGINAVVFFTGCIVTVILIFFHILFDAISVAFAVVRAVFYLIGLTNSV